MAATATTKALRQLARELGVQLEYHDLEGTRHRASPEALRSIIAAFGVDIGERGGLAEHALSEHQAALAARGIDAVHVAWDGEPVALRLTRALSADAELVLTLESGESQPIVVTPGEPARLPAGLPFGYHDLEVHDAGRVARSRIICAPRHTHAGSHDSTWGLFVPLYAARSEADWGIGDLGSARQLLELLDETGGGLLGSTPLLATFADEPFEPSPYAPVSRLFWNENYLDLASVPELQQSAAARDLLRDRALLAERTRLNGLHLVDHRAVNTLKRSVLAHGATELLTTTGARRDAFESWRAEQPFLDDYARFRAGIEGAGADGVEYHHYVQWLMETQLGELDRSTSAGLYLDLPLGVHPDGFDRSAFADLFTTGMSIGAPPDPLAAGGQNWGLPPLHPLRLREDGYRYSIASLRHLFRHADAVRIDHVMGMHRLFWIPSELDASHGVYVGYAAEEQWAIVCLESLRNGCLVVGEDLGTVPDAVREAMTDHRARRTYVAAFELDPDGESAIRPAPDGALATLDTHDTATWATMWSDQFDAHALDAIVDLLRRTGDLTIGVGVVPAPEDVHDAVLRWLARGDAGAVIANLEDFWGERDPQNVPGTGSLEAPNWVRRTARTIEAVRADDELRSTLEQLTQLRTEDTMTTQHATDVRHDVPMLTADDLHLFNEGRHNRLHRKLGSHTRVVDGVAGTTFAVWAPNAESVSVIGDFNGWQWGVTELRAHGASGIWEGFVAGVEAGSHYKYAIASRHDGYRVEKADPFARRAELAPKTASIIWADGAHEWSDAAWMQQRSGRNGLDAPMSVYEMHAGSWMRVPEDGDRFLGYRELAPRLIDYLSRTGFTHVQFMPLMEHPFYGSWGYQTTGYFAPTTRYGSPDDLRFLIDELHNAGFGVLLDWVPSHFPTDEFALGYFDGTHLFEHADPRQGFHPDWKSWIFNYARNEVRSFLLSSALYWLEEYHVDGLRVDAVASMLYLDYSRKDGEWIPNVHGGRENLDAIEFMRQLNRDAYGAEPDIAMIAEESTAWGGVSRPIETGGIGFGMKWDMGWMHDTLEYFAREPVHRRHHQGELTFRQLYAYTENFMLPLSHDEVVHGKGSLIDRMPGDTWQQFANLRLLYSYMWTLPGKKLLFMGGEFAQWREWNHDSSLDWHLLDQPLHTGIMELVGDLNRLYRDVPALHELDVDPAGFSWVDASDSANSVFSYLRHGKAADEPPVLVVLNATPVARENYRVGVPRDGHWGELFNSDATTYGGSGVGNFGGADAAPVPAHGQDFSLSLTLPPLGCVILRPGSIA